MPRSAIAGDRVNRECYMQVHERGKCCNSILQEKKHQADDKNKQLSSIVMSAEQTLNHNNAQGTENISSQIDYSNGNPMNLSYANIKMIKAFGVPLMNSDGKERVEKIGKNWERSAWLRGKMYRVPGGP